MQSRAAISVAFQNAGTATGDAGIAERDAQLDAAEREVETPCSIGCRRPTARSRRQVGDEPEVGAVGGGSYAPVDGVAELPGSASCPRSVDAGSPPQ